MLFEARLATPQTTAAAHSIFALHTVHVWHNKGPLLSQIFKSIVEQKALDKEQRQPRPQMFSANIHIGNESKGDAQKREVAAVRRLQDRHHVHFLYVPLADGVNCCDCAPQPSTG